MKDAENEKPKTSDTPFFLFPKLKGQLSKMGIEIGEANAWRTVGTIEVLPEDIGTRITFENSGIYFDDNGIKRRGFMYKKAFYFEWNGKKKTPKFHICKCTAIENFGREAYRFANAEPIKVFSRDKNREVLVEGMELCGYCQRILTGREANRVKNSTDFVKILKEDGDVKAPENVELNIFGYVKNWQQISLDYCTRKNFTCEKCGVKLDNIFDREFIYTHHKNDDRTDNRESNLECLCIKCYSELDAIHRKRFSIGGNKVMLDAFTSNHR